MREGWEYKKLGEIGTFLRGSGILKSDFVEEGCPCIHYGQIHTKFGVSVDSHLSEISETLYAKSKIANPGDIILAITSEDVEGSCKCIAWLGNYDVAVGAHAAIYKHNQNSKYLSYCFRSKDFGLQKAKYAHGFKVVEIKPSEVAEITIPLPPLSTQQQIVSELDFLSHILDLKRQQLKEYDALAESIFYDMFGDPVENPKGWEVKKISEIGNVKIGPFGSLLHSSDYVSGGIPLVNPIHMKDGHVSADNNFTITKYKAESLSNYLLRTNDIILARRGDIGRCAIITDKENGYVCGTGSLFIRTNESLSPIYSTFLVQAKSMKDYLISQAQGVTMLNINCKIVENLRFPLPPLSLQQTFAEKIESIDHQKQLLKESIKETETIFQSRMDYWFNA